MANEFNANDIFEIAIKIEQNGAIFYRNAAEQVGTEKHKRFLLDLARMEDDHEKTFTDMQKTLKDEETFSATFDPDDENALYLKALADTRVFFEKEQPDSSFKSILGAAIQTEKDSIVFYLGMKELVPPELGQSKIDDIIKEEMGHIRLLASRLGQSE
jgi:rubrerythrin